MEIIFSFDDFYHVLGIGIIDENGNRKAYPLQLPKELVDTLLKNKDKVNFLVNIL